MTVVLLVVYLIQMKAGIPIPVLTQLFHMFFPGQ